jgi:hypothetical protein
MRIQKSIARVFSTLFNPVIIPTLGLFILFQLNTYIKFAVSPGAMRLMLLLVFFNTAIAPVLSLLIMKRSGYVKSLSLEDRNERIFPLLLAAALFFITYYMLRQITLPPIVYFYIISSTLLLLVTLMVTFFRKISIHMVSLGGLTAFLIIASLLLRTEVSMLIIAAILVSGATGSSRLILKAHSPLEVYAGYLLGFGMMMGLFFYFLR